MIIYLRFQPSNASSLGIPDCPISRVTYLCATTMRFSEPFLLSFYLSLTLTAASPSPAHDLSGQSSLLHERGQCASCQRPGSPSRANNVNGRPIREAADGSPPPTLPDGPAPPVAAHGNRHPAASSSHNRGLRTPSVNRPPAASPPQGEVILGTAGSSYRPAAASRSGQSPVNIASLGSLPERPASERWARRLDRIYQVEPDFEHPDGAASPRWQARHAIVPRAASPGIMSSKNRTARKASKGLPAGAILARCHGPEKKHCEKNCYCNELGNFECDKIHSNLTGEQSVAAYTLLLKANCVPACLCFDDRGNPRMAQLTAMELAKVAQMHVNSGLRREPAQQQG